MKTDYDAIGKGFIDMLDENELALLAFGMIPHDKFKIILDTYFDVMAEKLTEKDGHYEGLEKEFVLQCLDKKWKNEEESKLAKAIYRNAKMVV